MYKTRGVAWKSICHWRAFLSPLALVTQLQAPRTHHSYIRVCIQIYIRKQYQHAAYVLVYIIYIYRYTTIRYLRIGRGGRNCARRTACAVPIICFFIFLADLTGSFKSCTRTRPRLFFLKNHRNRFSLNNTKLVQIILNRNINVSVAYGGSTFYFFI